RVARQPERRHVEEPPKRREARRERMGDAHDVVPPPGAAGEIGTLRAEIGDGGIERGAEKRRPVGVLPGEQVLRLTGHQLPQRGLELRRWPDVVIRRYT